MAKHFRNHCTYSLTDTLHRKNVKRETKLCWLFTVWLEIWILLFVCFYFRAKISQRKKEQIMKSVFDLQFYIIDLQLFIIGLIKLTLPHADFQITFWLCLPLADLAALHLPSSVYFYESVAFVLLPTIK